MYRERLFVFATRAVLTLRVRALIVRRPPPPKHVCRGVPPERETAVSAPLKVPPPRQKKTSAPRCGAARVDAGG